MGSGTNKVAAMLVGNSMGYEIDLELQIQTTITTFWYILYYIVNCCISKSYHNKWL